mgnify:CR=1 FL=1
MECYNCGAKLGKGDICQNCGANVKIYKKIIMASNAYYNDALEKAAVRDLSGAIESLRTSLRFYKMNIDARNLLGLVYFETGGRSVDGVGHQQELPAEGQRRKPVFK